MKNSVSHHNMAIAHCDADTIFNTCNQRVYIFFFKKNIYTNNGLIAS